MRNTMDRHVGRSDVSYRHILEGTKILVKNIFADIPQKLNTEEFKEIIAKNIIRIERIISKGHTSPEHGWYDQKENEWVMVLEGAATILFESGKAVDLCKGDYVNIPSHTRHKVTWTDPDNKTIWLAVHY
jgi:cupin 2 domain-containing protein